MESEGKFVPEEAINVEKINVEAMTKEEIVDLLNKVSESDYDLIVRKLDKAYRENDTKTPAWLWENINMNLEKRFIPERKKRGEKEREIGSFDPTEEGREIRLRIDEREKQKRIKKERSPVNKIKKLINKVLEE